MKYYLSLLSCLLVAARAKETGSLEENLTISQAWGYGMLSGVVLIIVLLAAGESLMCVKDCISHDSFCYILNLLYALGAGTMVGDVILHALPKAFASPDTYVTIVGLLFIVAIFSFVIMERSFIICGLTQKKRWGTSGQFQPLPLDNGLDNSGPDGPDHLDGPGGPGGPPVSRNSNQPLSLGDHWQSFVIPHNKLRQELKKIRERQAAQKLKKQQAEAQKIGSKEELGGANKQLNLPNSADQLEATDPPKKSEELESPKQVEGGPDRKQEGPQPGRSMKNRTVSHNIEAIRAFTTYQRKSDIKRSTQLIQESRKREEKKEKEESDSCFDRFKGKGAEGYLSILTAFIHNFFDGFALGAGFGSQNKDEFISILVAVYAQAIPRQLGDIAILMKTGFSDCQTKVGSALPKVTVLFGVAAGLGLEATGEAARYYVLSFVAGSFIYIASDIWKHLFQNRSLKKNFFELLMLILGVGIEFLLLLVKH